MAEPVRRRCPGCGVTVKVPEAAAARAVKCPKCGATVPGPPPVPEVGVPVVVAAPEPPADPFAAITEPNPFAAVGSAPRPVRPPSSGGALLWVALALLTAIGVAGGAIYGPTLVAKWRTPPTVATAKPADAPSTFTSAGSQYPRRMLVLSVTKYLYLNPLLAGNSANPDLVTVAARRLAYQWHVPTAPDNDQLFVVTDAGEKPTAMLKSTVVAAVKGFAETARPQDREAIYYGGHAAFLEGKAYLVPTDGDLDKPETLYPLDEFFKTVASAPAQEKFVIFDVRRVDESGNRERPGSEPMGEDLAKALLAPPPGVRVELTAKAGENALEFRTPPSSLTPEVGGSLFLSAVTHLAERGKVSPSAEPTPADPLPIDPWMEAIQKRMTAVAQEAGLPAPTLQTAGKSEAEVAVAPDEATPPATRFELPKPPVGLPVAEVATLAKRVEELPPYRGKPSADDKVDDLIPYPANVMAEYRPEGLTDARILAEADKYPIRAAAIRALSVIKKEWRSAGTGTEDGLRTEIRGATGEALKKEVLAEQEVPARIEDELDRVLRKIEKVADKLPEEKSRYWRATYQYAVAQVKARLAFMQEYNRSLGLIRTDSLPAVDEKKGEVGLTLVSSEKMVSQKEVKQLAESAADDFAKVAEEYPNTPWGVLARRHQLMTLGLKWKPSVFGKATKLE